MSPQRLEELLQRYIDARLSAAERDELESELLASPEARRTFWHHLRFEGAIQETVDTQQVRRWMTEDERAALAQAESHRDRGGWRKPILMWGLGLAAAAAFLVSVALNLRSPQKREGTSSGVAVLTGAVDVRWGPGQVPVDPGAILSPGSIRIESGLIGIEFYSGARVTLEGPADVDLAQTDQLFCRLGKIRVEVPDRARGFRVLSPRLDLVDLGTEFGVDITPQGRTELHVINGKVEVAQIRSSGAENVAREMVTGQGLRIDAAGVSTIPAQPGLFAGRIELNARLSEQTRTRYAAWQEASEALRRDPRLVLYYDFQPPNRIERVLPNRSPVHGSTLDGTVVGATWVEGRWPGKTALEFREPSDRVRIFIPGELDALTVVAWLRVDSFDTMFSGILLTDDFVKGAVHWQFYEGKIRLGIGGDRRPNGRIGIEYDVESVEPAALLGRWRQVAAVADMVKREVVLYLDGRPVKRAPILKPHRLSLGKAELGNWGLPHKTDTQPIRNFNGRMDEFMLFDQALTDSEIAALFEQGRPWPSPVAAVVR